MTTNREPGGWRVVLFTATAFAVPVMQERLRSRGHRLVGVVAAPGPRSRRTDDYLEVAQQARPGLDVIISNYPDRWADMIRPLRPDLLWCLGFNWKIPEAVLDVPRLGTVNFHDALLPKYRGRNAIGWALRNDEPECGITLHFMSPAFDSGPILAQRSFSITDDDYSFASIFPRFVAAGTEASIEALNRIAAGDPGDPQDESQATYAGGAFEPEWREIDWSDTARQTFVKVRSWYGARDVPRGAFGDIDGRRCLITATKLTYQQSNDQVPGTVLDRRDDGTLLIQCGDGPLEILEWSVAGEEPVST
jgi:methionyl-tRNA formyltransferase